MKHELLKKNVYTIEEKIFNCKQCKELVKLRENKEHNCPVPGFSFKHYLNAKVCSICEAPGIYKPHKGEILIEKLEDFHEIYDNRIHNVALIGQRLMSIFSRLHLGWQDVQHFNVVCCSPPNYRKPKIEEVASCLHYLKERLDLMQNLKVIIAFGKIAKTAVNKFNFSVPIVQSHHPSYLYSYMTERDREEFINDIVTQIKDVL